jgi:hypothetical protein
VEYPFHSICVKILFFFAVTNLAPGTDYIIEVSAYKKSFAGQPTSIVVKTDGKPLPKVSELVANLSMTDGTTVRLYWNLPEDDTYNEKWEYGVYYALNTTDLLSGMLFIEKLLKPADSKYKSLF